MPTESDQAQGHYLNAEDYTTKEYLSTMVEMLAHALGNNNYLEFTPMELGKLLQDLNGYTKVLCTKTQKLEEELKDTKSKLELKTAEEAHYHTEYSRSSCPRATVCKDKLDELIFAKERLEAEYERLCKDQS